MGSEERQHLESMRRILQRRLYKLREQKAALGIATPPEVLLEIEDLEGQIALLDAQFSVVTPQTLLASVLDFVGRDNEIARISELLHRLAESATVISIRGMPGIGKTQLALAAAHRLRAEFPDGQVLIELRGMRAKPISSEDALRAILRMFGYYAESTDVVELQQIYKRVLDGKRAIIVADDARNRAQVEPLTPVPNCALIVTSRQRFMLPGMYEIDLAPISLDHATELILRIAPRVAERAPDLARSCSCHPLALRVSASLLANNQPQDVGNYLARLADMSQKLEHLVDPDDTALDVEASLHLSYDALDTVSQDVLRQLSVFPASFDLTAAQFVVAPAPDINLQEILESLFRHHLVEWDAAVQRYALHDLVRAFGVRLNGQGTATHQRYARWYASEIIRKTIQLIGDGETPADMEPGLALFERERAHIDVAWSWKRRTATTPEEETIPDSQIDLDFQPIDALVDLHAAILRVYYVDPSVAQRIVDVIWFIAQYFPENLLVQAQAHWSHGTAMLPIPDYQGALEQYDEALNWYERARRQLAPHELTRDVWLVHIPRVFCLSELGRYREAQQAAAEAERWLNAHPNPYARLILLLNLSQLAGTMRHFERMIELADQTIDLADQQESPAEAAMGWVNRGYACIYLGRLEDADIALSRGIALAQESAELLTVARALWNRARLLRYQGRLFDALKTLREAQKDLLRYAPNERPTIALEEAAIAEQLRHPGAARRAAQIAAEEFARQHMPAYSADAALLATHLAIRQGRTKDAREAIALARSQAKQAARPTLEAEIRLIAAELTTLPAPDAQDAAVIAQRYKARATAQRAVDVLYHHRLVQEAAQGELTIAKLDSLLGDVATARERYERLTRHSQLAIQLDANDLMADLLPPAESLPYRQQAAALALTQQRRLHMEELQARYSSETLPYHMRLAACHLTLGDVRQAFESVCTAKAAALLDLRAATADLDAATLATIEQHKAEINRWREEQQLHFREQWKSIREEQKERAQYHEKLAAAAAMAVNTSEKRLTEVLQTIGMSGGETTMPRLPEIRNRLRPDWAILEYAQIGDELVCFVVRQVEEPAVYRLGHYDDLLPHFDRWAIVRDRLIVGRDMARVLDDIRAVLAPLHDSVIAPLKSQLTDVTDLLIAPYGILHHLPWALLLDQTGWSSVLTPSSAMWAAPTTWDSTPTNPPLLLGYAGHNARWLPRVNEELDRIKVHWPNANVHRSATSAELRTVSAPELLHIAAHGLTSPDNPLASTIELADGPFTLLEAHRLNLRGTRFVALSACATGERPNYGDMALALAGAFLCAGARSVLASLWAVDDTATMALMDHVYAALARGVAPAAALCQAQQQIRSDYPLDWAAFQIWMGSTDSTSGP